MFSISNAEFVLLSLLDENGPSSGYRLNRIIRERGYREWADIGSTSVYTGLKKLEDKRLLEGELNKTENTKGPAAKVYTLLDKGLVLLREETAEGLSHTRERDRRFDLALSAIHTIPKTGRFKLLAERKEYLSEEYSRLSGVLEKSEDMDWRGELLFAHTLSFIQCELGFLSKVMGGMHEEK